MIFTYKLGLFAIYVKDGDSPTPFLGNDDWIVLHSAEGKVCKSIKTERC